MRIDISDFKEANNVLDFKDFFIAVSLDRCMKTMVYDSEGNYAGVTPWMRDC